MPARPSTGRPLARSGSRILRLQENKTTAEVHGYLDEHAARSGPELSRPLAVHRSRLGNLKELRPGSTGRSEIRILQIFDPRRNAVLLVTGDKAGKWEAWYR